MNIAKGSKKDYREKRKRISVTISNNTREHSELHNSIRLFRPVKCLLCFSNCNCSSSTSSRKRGFALDSTLGMGQMIRTTLLICSRNLPSFLLFALYLASRDFFFSSASLACLIVRLANRGRASTTLR